MAFKVRQSKFRHLFGEVNRNTYEDIKPSRKATEGPGIQGNEKRIALPWDSARKLCVLENAKHGRFDYSKPMINNNSPVLDHQLKKNLANKFFGYLARCEFWRKLGLRFWILVG